ncbi:hypothetical protein BsWGS_19162 [Bradybaena similaris]
MPRLKERGCLIVGGITVSLLTLGASFAPNIEVFIAIFTVKGLAFGLTYVPGIALIPQYFKRYRSRASVVPFCGGAAANIVGPFIIRAARDQYGVRGVFMILSAIELNYCVIGLLLRPVSEYRFRPDDMPVVINASAVQSSVPAISKSKSNDHLPHNAAEDSNEKMLQVTRGKLDDDAEAAEALLDRDAVGGTSHEETIDNTDKLVDGVRMADNSELSPNDIPRDGTLNHAAGTIIEHKQASGTDKPADKTLTRWQKFYQASALEMWSYRLLLLAQVPGSVMLYMISYMPTISKFQGASFDEAAFLATIMGTVDLVGRISTGFITDTKLFPPSRLFVIAVVCLGIGCHFFRFATSFVALIPMVIFIGMFVGTRGPLLSILCQDVVGRQKYPQAYSMSLVVLTFSSSLFNPALGAVVEATGSFVLVLHILGICFFLNAGLLACLPMCVRLDVKHGRTK